MTICRDRGRDVLQPLAGGTGFLATWQWTHSIGSDAMKGRVPVSIW